MHSSRWYFLEIRTIWLYEDSIKKDWIIRTLFSRFGHVVLATVQFVFHWSWRCKFVVIRRTAFIEERRFVKMYSPMSDHFRSTYSPVPSVGCISMVNFHNSPFGLNPDHFFGGGGPPGPGGHYNGFNSSSRYAAVSY